MVTVTLGGGAGNSDSIGVGALQPPVSTATSAATAEGKAVLRIRAVGPSWSVLIPDATLYVMELLLNASETLR
jgi:hypothetical protein